MVDPEVFRLNHDEMMRQYEGLELIASENFASRASMEALNSHFNNKYSEGYPGNRYYGGNEVVDKLERLTQERALKCFGLNPNIWGVNVQALSGSAANLAVYTGLIPPGGRLMGLLLSDGGHLTHGHRTKARSVSASSLFWQSLPYICDSKTSMIDYDYLHKSACLYKPHLIIAGTSSYPRNIDYKRIKATAKESGSILMADMAHISGLVAAGLAPSPFEFCDVVTTTTHKTLRGVRGSLIFYRKKKEKNAIDYESKINNAVFPGLQGGPHMHQVAAVAVCLKEAMEPEFLQYQKQVISNMRVMSNRLMKNGIKLVTNGTDTHLSVIDLRNLSIDGIKAEYLLDHSNISVNKNSIPGDSKPGSPYGIRIGSPALTSRGLKEKDFEIVADMVVRGLNIAQEIDKISGNKISDFKSNVLNNASVSDLRKEVKEFSTSFPLPGKIF